MKAWCAAISLCLAAPLALMAGLGQNELEIGNVYGQVASEEKKSDQMVVRQYNYKGLSVSVTFLNGTSQCEVFRKADGTPLDEKQIEKILEENSNHLDWTAKSSARQNVREWAIAGPKPSPSEKTDDPLVFAVSSRRPAAIGEGRPGDRQGGNDVLDTEDDSSSAPIAPAVLRRAIYSGEGTNACLKVFTAAYENAAKMERRSGR